MKRISKMVDLHALFGGGEATLGQAVDTFLRLEMVGKSEQTRHWYADRLDNLVSFMGERSISSLMEVDFASWLAELASRTTRYGGKSSRPAEEGGLSPYTLNGYITAARRFARWLFKRGLTPVDLSANLSKVRLPKIGKRGVSDADARAIVEVARASARDYAIVQFLIDTGGRLGGAARLELEDLQLDSPDPLLRQRATVREKGAKARIVFLGEEAQKALAAWLEIRPASDSRRVFLKARRDRYGHYQPLQESGIYTIIKRLAKMAGVKGPVSPHQFRHMFGRRMAENGMSLGMLSQVMGHTSPQVTVAHYGQFAVDELQAAYNRAQRRGKINSED